MSRTLLTYEFLFEKTAFENWQCEEYAESFSDERICGFTELLKRAIYNELSDEEIQVIQLYFYENYSLTQIADLLDINTSTVQRRIKKAEKTLFEKLKYAAEYRYGLMIAPSGAGGKGHRGLPGRAV